MTAKLRSSIKAGLNSGLRKSISGGVSATGLTYNITISGNTFALRSTGTVDYSVNWGDGSNETSTSNTLSHTFADGSYSVVVVTTLGKFRPQINNNADGDRITSIVIGARINLGTTVQRAWKGASFMTSFECPFHVTSDIVHFGEAWRSCSSLVSFPLIDTSGSTQFGNTWNGCHSLTSFPSLDVSNGTGFANTWYDCRTLTSFPLLDVSSGTNFTTAWRGCSGLTSFPSLDVSSGTNFSNTWRQCSSLTSFPLLDVSSGKRFDSGWSTCTSLANFPANMFDTTGALASTAFNNTWGSCALTAQSIENILVSLDTNGHSNITLVISGGTNAAKTTWSTAANTAYDNLITKGWTISFNA